MGVVALLTNTYYYNEEEWIESQNAPLLVTGLIGIFSDDKKAMNALDKTLTEFGVPKDLCESFHPKKDFLNVHHNFMPLNAIGRYTEDLDKAEYMVEIITKETEIDKVLQFGD